MLRYPEDTPMFKDYSVALATSDDTNVVVVGYNGYQPPTDAFIWKPETGDDAAEGIPDEQGHFGSRDVDPCQRQLREPERQNHRRDRHQ